MISMFLHIDGHTVTAVEVGHRKSSMTSVHVGYSTGSVTSMDVGHRTGSLTSKDDGLYEGLIDIKGCWLSGHFLDVVYTECERSLKEQQQTTTTNVYICRHTDINRHLISV